MSRAKWPRVGRLLDGLRHAFSTAGPHGPLTEADRELLHRLAGFVVRRRLSAPAILFLDSLRPLNYIGSQAMLFLRPFAEPFFAGKEYEQVAAILERRDGIHALIEAIEELSQAPAEPEASTQAQATSSKQAPSHKAQ